MANIRNQMNPILFVREYFILLNGNLRKCFVGGREKSVQNFDILPRGHFAHMPDRVV